MAIPFQHGDPLAIQEFSLFTDGDADTKAGVRARRSGFVTGALSGAFRGQGGTAAQAVNAEHLDPQAVRLESRQKRNAGNIGLVGKTYESADMDYGHNMNAVMAADTGPGSIGGAINPPLASA